MSSEVRPRDHCVMELHNYIQKKYGKQKVVKYNVTGTGPEHNCTWEAIACINDLEYGRGTSTTKKAAREEAARQALFTLRQYGLLENRSELSSEGEEATGPLGGDGTSDRALCDRVFRAT